MENKVKWTYSAKIQGGTRLTGSLSASSAEEATKLIKQFGFLDWKLTDPTGIVVEAEKEKEEKPPVPAPAPAANPPMPTPITPRLVPPSVQQPSMIPSPSPSRKEIGRFQRVIAGPQKEVLPLLQDALNKPNAKVMHVCMHPDAHGVMWFVYVVESDEEEIK